MDISGLTRQQKEAFELFKVWLDDKSKTKKKRFVLTGSGGTGKSFLLKTFADYANSQNLKVKLLAPTHQAAKVLKSKTDRSVSTTAKGLGIAPNVNVEDYDPANPKFKILKTGEVVGNDLAIQDEGSMLPHDIACLLQDEIYTVFAGDIMQLSCIKAEPIKFLDTPDYVLTETLRTNKQDIIDLSGDLRQTDWQSRLKKLKPSDNIEIRDKNLFEYDGETVLCYRNVTVGTWNSRLRKHKQLNTEDKYKFYKTVGEWDNCDDFTISHIKDEGESYLATIVVDEEKPRAINIWKTKHKNEFAEMYVSQVAYAKSLYNKNYKI